MRKPARDAGVVAAVAALTAAGVLAVAPPRTVVAEGEAKAAPVERPALKVDGVVLTLVTDKQKYKAGEKPRLTLTVVNTRDNDVSLDALLGMLTIEAASPMMRMMPMPKEVWRHKCALKLAPGETKAVEIATETALAAGHGVTFLVRVGKQTLAAARLDVPGIKVLEPATLAAALEKAKAQPDAQPPAAKPEARADAGAR